jgi:DnaJ-class molecular chaperone
MASAAEIRSAFRRLAKQCHPDKVYHLGEDAQRLAHDKFTRLKTAYDSLLERQKDGG